MPSKRQCSSKRVGRPAKVARLQEDVEGKNTVGLDDFDRIKTLGMGAFGRVMLVKDKRSGTHYAMKILDKEEVVQQKQVKHTLDEKTILQETNSPFIVNLAHSFKDTSNLYLVLEFVRGGNLYAHFKKERKLSEETTRFYAAQIALALEYLHSIEVVYRDLKPENILIDSTGYLKLTDFGFAKRVDSCTRTFCGTPQYMAPEIVLFEEYNKAVDWWALGVLIYELATGIPPFYGDTVEIYDKIAEGTVKYWSFYSEELKDLLENLLQMDPTERYGNMENGADDVKDHAWFEYTDFVKIHQRQVVPPFVPTCSGPGDTSNFKEHEEEDIRISKTEQFATEFADF